MRISPLMNKLRVEVLAHELNGLPEASQAFERQVLALDGHDHAVDGCGQRVDRQQPQAGRAVDQDVVVGGRGAARAPCAAGARAPG